MHETENANQLENLPVSSLLNMLADANDASLMFPEKKWADKGFITGRAIHVRGLNTLRFHIWIDPRVAGYTFILTRTGNTPIMRFDIEFTALELAESVNQDNFFQKVYDMIKIDLDGCEVNGLPGMGIEAVSKDA